MPLIPNTLERFLFITLNQAPAALLDVFGAAGLRLILTAADMGIFDSLENGPASIDELATATGTDQRGLRLLLEALDSFGYVRIAGDRYANTRETSTWLLSSSPGHMLDFLRWWNELVYRFLDENLEVSIREGRAPENLYDWISKRPDGWEIAQAGFEAIARLALDDIVKSIELPEGARKLLDVGGGHGLYSIELCRRNPELTATVFDLPLALERARTNIEVEKLDERVNTRAGHYLQDEFGGPYDAAFLFNVIHAHNEAENVQLLRRVGECLSENGRIYVMDQMAEVSLGKASGASNRMLALAYYVGLNGSTYSVPEVTGWLAGNGYGDVKRRSLIRAPGTVILSATWQG